MSPVPAAQIDMSEHETGTVIKGRASHRCVVIDCDLIARVHVGVDTEGADAMPTHNQPERDMEIDSDSGDEFEERTIPDFLSISGE